MNKMSTKIIHIFNDDKFVDAAISIMEYSHPNESEYYVIKNDENDFNYVKSGIVKRLKLTLDKDYSDFIKELKNKKTQVVFLHALDFYKQKMVLLLPEKIVKVWLIWGYDLYGNWQLFNDKLYEKKTFQALNLKKPSLKIQLINNSFSFWLFDKTNKKAIWLPNKISNILKSNFYNIFYKAAEKIDIVIPVIKDEYVFIKKLKLQAKLGTFSYGTLEDLLKGNDIDNVLNKSNILLGNSADPSNNHLDVFDKLRNFNFKDRKLFVPLSYGGTAEYKEKVIDSGKEIFGDSFVPLLDFMSLDKYNEILSSCGFAIFNHVRQQGVGNIVSMGHLGAKLFLNSKSPVLKYFSNLGMKIFDIDTMNEFQLSENITNQELDINRMVLNNEYSKKAVNDKVLNLLKIVNELIINKNK
jgi:hypothetical protein